MRSVLTILGIACAALVLSLVLQNSKELSPAPQVEQADKKEQEQAAERRKFEAQQGKQPRATSAEFKAPRDGVVTVTLTVAGKGDIVLELYPKVARQTVEHFAGLVKSGFYNGVKFHRVERDFVVQAGDPKTKEHSSSDLAGMDDSAKQMAGIGSGGSGTKIPFEPNDLPHVRGSLAMALSQPRTATGDSQFFINLRDNVQLNGDYCVFGKVTRGMEVVDKIAVGDAIATAVVK